MTLHRTSGRTRLGVGLAATTMVVWGTLPVALSVMLKKIDPVTITWFRFALSALVLLGWLWRRQALPRLGSLTRPGTLAQPIWGLLAIATLGLGANYVLFLEGLDRTTPANVQILIQLSPLLLALGGIVIFRERFNRIQWLGFAILVGGLLAFFADQLAAFEADGRYLLGSGIILAAAITWAIYGLAQKQLLLSLSSQALMLCIYVGCAAGLSPFAQPASLTQLNGIEIAILVYCALNTVVGYGAFAASLEHLEASRVAAILALTPISTLVFVSLAHALDPGLLTPEHFSIGMVAGAIAVVVGSILTSRATDPTAK